MRSSISGGLAPLAWLNRASDLQTCQVFHFPVRSLLLGTRGASVTFCASKSQDILDCTHKTTWRAHRSVISVRPIFPRPYSTSYLMYDMIHNLLKHGVSIGIWDLVPEIFPYPLINVTIEGQYLWNAICPQVNIFILWYILYHYIPENTQAALTTSVNSLVQINTTQHDSE